ncbi:MULTISPECIES: HAD family hydrolase [Streptomycetaceae]|uniref:HAD-superfamily hydrolase, subfamily IA, variant 3 n=1 Tax=Streptantibioticus cattleyicolor (strain ATCC 35852 / DSM 46488 / JCM 4925 / NBRC 14057 / NRRL 8057) TaxID=1003195 RepID=F8JW56_STREN|nr:MULTISPECIES: HAD family phosphatase [Streptomycetaceae]AEW93226.1 HAD-superfamily hydrolase, subfamily IA, variant 3 [Streptantibioticus cattleyicolor NRRL 8057 = DSM 46488]MYS57950.1 beta-phosphoglucomutase family hydrolase [Streptomyces sp. SID5468]CCB73589.1 Hydrolase [Streptantibioticus cattleyicolor NRRL 8057 = DSM 46488]
MDTRAVIFDLDGTLVDSEPAYYEAGRQLLARYGVDGYSWEHHARFVGIGTEETLAALRAEYRIAAPVQELLAGKNRIYLELAGRTVRAFPGMRELVERLRAAGVPMAVASGSSPRAIRAVLAGTGLDGAFALTVSAEQVEHGKPAPDVFLAAAERLGVAPERCVVLEDAAPGVTAAARAGMRCVAVPYLPEQADDPAFASADLLFPGGQREFDAARTYAWIMS